MPPKSGLVKFAPEKYKKFATTDKTFPQKMPRHNKWQTPTGHGGVHSEQPAPGVENKKNHFKSFIYSEQPPATW